MNMIRIAALVAGVLFSHSAFAQCSGAFPANVACGTSVAGSPTAKSLPAIVGTQTANTVWAGPTTGSAAIPGFRALVAADIPGSFSGFANPTATVGLSAVNGSATTAMRSDASPPLSSGVQTSLTGTDHGVLVGTGAVGFGATAVMTDGQILTGQSAANPLPKTMSGDATFAASGAITLASVISGGGPTGSATIAPIITWDAKGRLTVVSSATITPAIGSITGLGTGVATALGVNVGSAGALVVNGGALGTPSSGVATNLTGTASGLTAGNVTTNANMTGDVTSVGNATTIASHAVTNAKAAQMAASTIKGNPTTSTADASDFTIAGLTHKASPATSDLLMLSDVSASNAYKYATIAEIVGSIGTGVTSIAGNTGAFTLGQGLTNSTNVILTGAGVQTNTLLSKTANYTIASTDCGQQILAGTGSSGKFTITLPVVAGFDTKCTISVLNGDTSTLSGKLLSGFPSDCISSKFFLFPAKNITVSIVNGAWKTTDCPGLFVPTAAMTFLVDTGGSDSTGDGFTAAFATIQQCVKVFEDGVDYQEELTQPTCSVTGGQTFSESVVHYVPVRGTNTLNITGSGSAFTWKPSGSSAFALAHGNGANIQLTNVTFSGASTTCGTAGTCTFVLVHNQAIFETLTGVTCDGPGNGAGTATAGFCFGTDINASGGTRINVDNGITITGTGQNVIAIQGSSYVNWNGTITASGTNNWVQMFQGFANSTVWLQGNFNKSGSFGGTPRQFSMQGLSVIYNLSGNAIPGSAGATGTGSLSCTSFAC